MKKKINRRLAVVFVMSFVIYMLFGQMTQLLQLQKNVVRESEIIISQLARTAEQMNVSGSEDEGGWNKVLSFAVPDEAVKMLIVDSATEKVLGATAEELSGKTLRELGFMPNEYRKYGNGFHVSIDDEAYYGVFYEYDGVLYGRFKSQGVI